MILNQFPADLQLEMLIGSFLAVNDSPLEIQNSGGRKYIVIHYSGAVGLTSNKQLASLTEHIEVLFKGIIKKGSAVGLKRHLLQDLADYKQSLEQEIQATSESVHPLNQALKPSPILIQVRPREPNLPERSVPTKKLGSPEAMCSFEREMDELKLDTPSSSIGRKVQHNPHVFVPIQTLGIPNWHAVVKIFDDKCASILFSYYHKQYAGRYQKEGHSQSVAFQMADHQSFIATNCLKRFMSQTFYQTLEKLTTQTPDFDLIVANFKKEFMDCLPLEELNKQAHAPIDKDVYQFLLTLIDHPTISCKLNFLNKYTLITK